ncbi:hypothetical protein GQ55_9G466500 [Panicum hallii var. hallii]|uniref:Uncharacterized protein n=1 Tax=Panicum hallii var. hallii TaxID=1504633 RepID=A0A2T7CCB6_9POAL|nr:hypothetical protein GQ55_9G466500 [Panicum hallii var. hallii]
MQICISTAVRGRQAVPSWRPLPARPYLAFGWCSMTGTSSFPAHIISARLIDPPLPPLFSCIFCCGSFRLVPCHAHLSSLSPLFSSFLLPGQQHSLTSRDVTLFFFSLRGFQAREAFLAAPAGRGRVRFIDAASWIRVCSTANSQKVRVLSMKTRDIHFLLTCYAGKTGRQYI